MTEQIDTIQDLIRILEAHPEWRARLRPLLLANELLTLPDQIRALTDRVAELATALTRTEQHLGAMAVAQAHSNERLSKVEDALLQLAARTDERLSKVEDALLQLATALTRTEQHLGAMAVAQAHSNERLSKVEDALLQLAARTDERLSKVEDALLQLAAAQARSDERLSKVEDALLQLATAQARTEERLVRVERDVSILKGDVLELRYGKRSVAAYGRWLRRSRILSHEQVYELLDDAVDAERLTMDERDQIAQADVLVHGKDKATGEEVYLVIEVSWGVGVHDVEWAADRAALLARIGTSTRAAVVGRVIMPEAEKKAHDLGVWYWSEEQLAA